MWRRAGCFGRSSRRASSSTRPTISEGPCAGSYEETWLAKIAVDGTIRWAKRIVEGCQSSRGYRMVATPRGTVLIWGNYWDASTVGPGTPGEIALGPSLGSNDDWWGEFDTNGEPLQVHTLASPALFGDNLRQVAMADDGVAHATGLYKESVAATA